ncbi:Fanconi anemia group C protein [Gouania willdenowi]|uniref:Fanconi anemia group C protein n=1 Tax=Gouania willdenowi TaxID=441366 RepID=UPI00105520D1|nr:Fanconi anemia group C protein [Gouania willdenowi]
MCEPQPGNEIQEPANPSLDAEDLQFWLDKAVAWGQFNSLGTHKDTCLHFSRLRDFLQQLLTHINYMSSTADTLKKLPLLGQFLGRLCWIPFVTADDTTRGLLLQCLSSLYSKCPSNAMERKANEWIRKVLYQLTAEDAMVQAVIKQMGVSPQEYHRKVLSKTVEKLQEKLGKSCTSSCNIYERCSCDHSVAVSEACVSLVSVPEASPLFGSLLQRPGTCVKETISENFLDALSCGYTTHSLSLDESAQISLWCRSLLSLEAAVMSLLESVTITGSTPQSQQQQVSQSLLPKACAQHFSIFLVVSDIFRSVLKQAEGNECVKSLVQTFSRCFRQELLLLQPQMSVSLKAFFPQSPFSLVAALFTEPSEMPQEAWRNHLNWLSCSLQRLTEKEEEEEEEGDGNDGVGLKGQQSVFEAWFLLVQCSHWVQVALQMLATSGLKECGPPLWLLTFYHHPTNRGHYRDVQLVRARAVYEHLHSLFSSAPPHHLPTDHLQSLVTLMSPQPQPPPPQSPQPPPPPPAPSLTLSLLVHFAVHCQLSPTASAEVLQAVVEHHSAVADEALCVLSSMELWINDEQVHLRIQGLINTIRNQPSA